ncbi:AraC family transcriptional regulator [Paenibacillus sp. GD4]|uniref:helix-turn-helix transcriptional regulator n=1 Tax=Paenibacillus sp. GD4 TaxID=3068890 RepID=UPI002796B74D|nr:AraC family transcriptional regulator [Paenibacillus sp. GD4]MDQ1910565.1 AraC family transcriptional regulator [Paenibacillus sp. GD4]
MAERSQPIDLQQEHLLRSYLENTQMNLHIATYTKVSHTWGSPPHTPDVNRLYYIREGEGWIKIKGRHYEPRPGQLILLPAGVRLSFGTQAWGNTYGKYWCHFTSTVGDISLFQMLDVPYVLDFPDEGWLEQRFQELIKHHSQPTLTSPLRIKSVLHELVSAYMETAAEQERGVRMVHLSETGKINSVLAYIDERLHEPITVEELAQLVHFHPNYFMPYFKSMLGVSPIAYINRKRMEKARELLVTTELTVTDVAEQVGFELYYFSRLFKRMNGMSPSEFRKLMQRLSTD